jgi:hypothetical protein
MKFVSLVLGLIVALGAASTPEPEISYFSNVRDVHISQPGLQNYFFVDEEIWNRARPDLADLRIYDGGSQVQYALSEQRGGTSSQEAAAKILNLGSVGGRTEFDLDMLDLDTGQTAEYDRIRLNLDAKDFVVTASVTGSNELGAKAPTQLPPATVYDFTREELGSNPVLRLPASSFHYLHVKLSAGISPAQVKGASVYNLQETKAIWTSVGACSAPSQIARNDRDYLQCATARSGGSRPLRGGSQPCEFPAGGHALGRKRPWLRGEWRNHAGADEPGRHIGCFGRDGCADWRPQLR